MATRLRVGVDAANLPRDRRGMGRYVRSVLRRFATTLSHRVELTLLVPDLFPALVRARYAEDLPGGVGVARRTDADRVALDVVWYPWNGMTWTTSVKSVATVHDVWPFVAPSSDARVRAREQTQYREAAARASALIAVSDFTKREIVRLLGVDPARIHVIHQAAAPPLPLPAGSTATARRDARERYLLFVGEVEPRKDIATLLEAMQRLPTDLRATTKLIVVGRARGLPHAAGNGTQVELAGEIADDAQLAELYAGAAALAFPSRYEGFGLPVLEAMSYGTPVVASDAASIPEVGGDAALYFPCGDAAALSAALTRVLREPDLATSMRTAGIARARAFDEETRAAQTLAVLETAART